jgi:hypothetical protein
VAQRTIDRNSWTTAAESVLVGQGAKQRGRLEPAIEKLRVAAGTESAQALALATAFGQEGLIALTTKQLLFASLKGPAVILQVSVADIDYARETPRILSGFPFFLMQMSSDGLRTRSSLVVGVEGTRAQFDQVPKNQLLELLRWLRQAVAARGTDSIIHEIRDRLDEARQELRRLRTRRVVALTVGFVGLAAGSITFAVVGPFTALFIAAYAAMFELLIMPSGLSSARASVQSQETELDFLLRGAQNREEQAYRLFKLHQAEIQRYYDQSLSQGRTIFSVGLVCMFVGVGIIIATLVLITRSTTAANSRNVIAVVGAVGAILANFVGAIYLRMYSGALGALSEIHSRLVTTHHLHFGNFLAAEIEDKSQREATWAAMSTALAVHGVSSGNGEGRT